MKKLSAALALVLVCAGPAVAAKPPKGPKPNPNLTIKSSAKIQDEALFLIELSYGAVITVHNVPQELLSAVVLVETPRLMFPFARNIVAETTRDGGFPPLMINPIDFAELLRRNSAAQAGAPAGGTAMA